MYPCEPCVNGIRWTVSGPETRSQRAEREREREREREQEVCRSCRESPGLPAPPHGPHPMESRKGNDVA